ncbi:OsmC family protein [Streptomyces sp. ADI93-02]|uniref:OsmC family protein n=1 Tax=Streptomyces sp. ADI93-02 TaxID=1522757 RepID=UPI000F556F3D|nr:OsmC family protein [Streptomyces sp. ADI93-02]RPK32221.1 OsmC-like protein [Streptomyces sp. ADI93-02]
MSTRSVSVREGQQLARSITAGPHRLTADEPRPISTDTGPNPGELLLAALGACTSMTVRSYAGRHEWPLQRVDVDVAFDAQGQIVKKVALVGDLERAQVERLLTVAGRCPIHRLLTKELAVVTVPSFVAANGAQAPGAAELGA